MRFSYTISDMSMKRQAIPLVWITVVCLLSGCSTVLYDGWRMDRQEPELSACLDQSLSPAIVLVWRKHGVDPIRFSPIVGFNRLFIGTDGNKMYALNPRNGAILWTFLAGSKISACGEVQQPFASSYPILWFNAEDGYLYAVNALDGSQLWKIAGGDIRTKWASGINYHVPRYVFTIFNISVYATLRAVDGVTGALIWEKVIGNTTTATPLVVYDGGHNLLIQGIRNVGQVVKAYNSLNGEELWVLNSSTLGSVAYTSGAYGYINERLYISLKRGSVEAFNINTQYRLWSAALPTTDDVLGFAYKWVGGSTDGVLIVVQDRYTHALEARSGKILWTVEYGPNPIDGETYRTSMPAICGDLVLHVEGGDHLVARRLNNGQEMWNYRLDGPTVSSPALSNRMIFIATSKGTIYAFGECKKGWGKASINDKY